LVKIGCRSYFLEHVKVFTIFSQQAVNAFMAPFVMGGQVHYKPGVESDVFYHQDEKTA
jgi:hypothetical protein